MQVVFVSGSVGVGGIELKSAGTVGVGGLVKDSVGVGGVSGKIPGGDFGGKGVESNRHGGKVWRFEAEERNGGIGADSSVEKVGMKDIAGDGFGGVGKSEERSMSGDCKGTVGTEERRVVVVEEFGTGGKFESCSHAVDSHMRIVERTIRNSRRMHRSLYFQPCPLSIVLHDRNILLSTKVDNIVQTSDVTRKLRSGFCRAATHVDADNRRRTT